MEVLGRVFVFGTVTAADMAAVQTHPQMNPRVAGFQALFTTWGVGPDVANRTEVRALLSHRVLQPDYCHQLLMETV